MTRITEVNCINRLVFVRSIRGFVEVVEMVL